MPNWRFPWSQCVIFTGPIIEVISEAWRCTPIRCCGMHARAAWTCMCTPAGCGATKCERNTTIRAVHVVVFWNLDLRNWHVDYFELFSSSNQDHERPQSCWGNHCARTCTHAAFERWIGENWVEPLPFERATWSDPKVGITFGAGQNETPVYNGGTSSDLMSPPSTEAPVESCWPDGSDAGAWTSVATRRSCSCACLSISPTVFMLRSECRLPTW